MEYSMNQGGRKKKKKICIVLLVLLVLCVVALTCLKLFYSRNYFEILIESTFDYLRENVNQVSAERITYNFDFQITGNSTDADSKKVLDFISKIDLSGSYGVDYGKKILNLKLNSDYDTKQLFDADIYMQDGNGYMYFHDLYDKYIQFPVEDYNSIFQRVDHSEDYIKVFDCYEKALMNSLKEDYFEEEKVTVRSEKVNKVTLHLSRDNYKEIYKSIVDSLLSDPEFLESYSRILESDVSTIKESFQKSLEEENDFEGMDVILYTKGSSFFQLEFLNDTDKITVYVKEDKYIYEYYSKEELVFDGSIAIQKNQEKDVVTVLLNVKEQGLSIEVVVNSSIQEGGNVEKEEIVNSVSYEEMTEEEMKKIYSNLLSNEGFMAFLQEISTLSNLNNSSIGIVS